MRVKDSIAIVTGGGGGIGSGICRCLTREGADIVVSDINRERAKGRRRSGKDRPARSRRAHRCYRCVVLR